MKLARYLCLFLLLAGFHSVYAGPCRLYKKDTDNKAAPIKVSAEELMKNPQKYHEKNIYVEAVGLFDFELNAICLDGAHDVRSCKQDVELDSNFFGPYSTKKEADEHMENSRCWHKHYDKKMIGVEGIFELIRFVPGGTYKNDQYHLSWIKNISRIDLLE